MPRVFILYFNIYNHFKILEGLASSSAKTNYITEARLLYIYTHTAYFLRVLLLNPDADRFSLFIFKKIKDT